MEGAPGLPKKLELGVAREAVFGPVKLNLDKQEMQNVKTGATVHLSPQEYQVLWLLVRAQGAIISADEAFTFLYRDLPDDQDLPLGNGVIVVINALREKLEQTFEGTMDIENIRNMGYRLTSTS